MYRARWGVLLVLIVVACGAPAAVRAPGTSPAVVGAGVTLRPVSTIAALLLEPLALRGTKVQPFSLVRSESGEPRVRQIMIASDGGELLRVESALNGSIRLVARSGVSFEGPGLSEGAATARALRHLLRLGLSSPADVPTVREAAERTLVVWPRRVRGVVVRDDGIRIVMNGVGALVGLAVDESPLGAAPIRLARAEAALAAAATLLPSGAQLREEPALAWVNPIDELVAPARGQRPRRLAWCVGGVLRDGAPFELQLDAGNLALLGWDGAP